jgi:SAM-dependent methyltransferase
VNSLQDAHDRAVVYDRFFVDSKIRSDVLKIADRFFTTGMRLLDVGCGTGEDAIHFAQRGLTVTAIDISPAVIGRLMVKCGNTVRCEVADMRTYTQHDIFDGVFSNFSAINYVSELDWLSRFRLKPGAHLVFTTLGRFYPLESAVFLLKGRPRMAVRRFRRSCDGQIDGIHFKVFYHSLRTLRMALGKRFELKEVTGLRALRPIPELDHLQRFQIVRLLNPIDRWWCAHRPLAVCSDQFVSVWQFLG